MSARQGFVVNKVIEPTHVDLVANSSGNIDGKQNNRQNHYNYTYHAFLNCQQELLQKENESVERDH